MFTKAAVFVWLVSACALAQQTSVWEFPNFSDRVDAVVANTADHSVSDVVTLKMADVRKMAPGFPGTLAIVATATQPAVVLETEIDSPNDAEGDGEFSIAVKLGPHERQTLSIYYSKTLHDDLADVKHVYASHNYGYNHATAAIESELIGYRTYGGFFFDVQAHAKGQSGLFNSLLGYSSISHPPIEGEDVIHLGDTLGLGGLFLRAGNDIYRPPLNTPDYTHRTPKPNEPAYEVLSAGPLRAIIEANLPDWTIGRDHVAIRALYEIDAGSEVIHCRWWITPLHVSNTYEIGAGIRDLSDKQALDAPGIIATSGLQDPNIGRVALGLSFAAKEAHRAGSLATPNGGNQIVIFTKKLQAGKMASGKYAFAAAWSGSGWKDVAVHVRDALEIEDDKPNVKLVGYMKNPNVKGLEGEPK